MVIAEPGFRRALEYLIKDFAISENSAAVAEIKAKLLGPCITDHIQNERIKTTARGATYIGNDETHYERRWPEKDISDLKKFIHTVVYWIEAELTTKEMQTEMGV